MAYELHSCDVCELMDGDTTPKMSKHCGGCKAWICQTCEPDMIRRAQAMLKRARARIAVVGKTGLLPLERKQ